MNRDSRGSYRRRSNEPFIRKNQMIRVPKVLLIDEKGENVGEMATDQALELAKKAGLDLVEVGPKARPPVCKIIDYSKHLYEQKKKQRKNKKKGKVKSMKEFKFSPVIEEHDSNHRIKRAKEYLGKGHQVRITMYRKGRISREQAESTFAEILTNFEGYSSIEPEPRRDGRNIFLTFKPEQNNGKSKKTKQSKKDSSETSEK